MAKAAKKPSSIVPVALTQMACVADVRTNRANQMRLIESAAKKGAKIICTQEMFASQYFCQVEDHSYFSLAESIHGAKHGSGVQDREEVWLCDCGVAVREAHQRPIFSLGIPATTISTPSMATPSTALMVATELIRSSSTTGSEAMSSTVKRSTSDKQLF